MIKEFFNKNTHLKLSLQHVGINGGGFEIKVYNTTWDYCFSPIFMHFVSDFDIEHLKVDFETIIMTPIINWWDDIEQRRLKKGE